MRSRRDVCLLGATGFAAALVVPAGALAQPRHFRDQNLSGKDFSRQRMTYQDYSRANFEKSDLSYADCSHSIFKGANFRGATLRYTRFMDADLSGADLRDTDTKGTNFRNAKLWDANLAGVSLFLAGAVIETPSTGDKYKDEDIVNARKRIMSSLSDVGAGLDRDSGSLSFRGANLRNALIVGNLAHVDFLRADLRGADLSKATGLQDAMFRGAIYDQNTEWKIDPALMGAVKAKDDGPAH
jgi:uncharacterized protein YjbI with pentapeptide repeats